jgi:hypothetical protein
MLPSIFIDTASPHFVISSKTDETFHPAWRCAVPIDVTVHLYLRQSQVEIRPGMKKL